MGMTYVTVHIRKNENVETMVVKKAVEKITREMTDEDCYIDQKGFLTIIPPAIEMENFESTAEELSQELAVLVLVTMVFDSDVAVIQLYKSGQKETEFVKSYETNEDMDIDKLIEILELDCKASDIEAALSSDDIFAEEILEALGDILNVNFLIMND